MRKYLFLWCLLFPVAAYGQSFTGNYRAVFFNLLSEPKRIIAEFEVSQTNSIIAKVKIGDEIKTLTGSVDKKGKFEVVSPTEGNVGYKLKGKFDKNSKVSFIRRIEERSTGNKSVSENGWEAIFFKVTKTESETNVSINPNEPELIDNGKSQLKIRQSSPIFGNDWTDFTGKVLYQDSEDGKQLELSASVMIDGQKKRSIRIYTKAISSDQKVWKTTDLQTASYREETGDINVRNAFLTAEHIYKENSALQNGTLEIVKETENQIIFKLKNFRIKRITKEDFVEINGFIYANKGEILK